MWHQTTRNFIKTSFKMMNLPQQSYSTNLNWANKEITSLIARTLPLPCLSAINVFNIREMLENCSQEDLLATTEMRTNFQRTKLVLLLSNICDYLSNIRSTFCQIIATQNEPKVLTLPSIFNLYKSYEFITMRILKFSYQNIIQVNVAQSCKEFHKYVLQVSQSAQAILLNQSKLGEQVKLGILREITCLMARTLPLPCLSAINIFNIREMLQKCIDENGLATSEMGITFQRTNSVLPLPSNSNQIRTSRNQHIEDAAKDHSRLMLIINWIFLN